MNCLIVDDSPAFLASASRLLASQGLAVAGTASTTEEAMTAFDALAPSLVLVDIELGAEDGLELTRRLIAHAPDARVVLISTHGREDLAELIIDSPALGFLRKDVLDAARLIEMAGNE